MTAMTALCPACTGPLHKELDIYRCDACKRGFHRSNRCPSCQHELEQLQACGSASYFCTNCNELKSRQVVIQQYQPL